MRNPSPAHFFDALTARAQSANSLLCIGLDPHPDTPAGQSAATAREFCLRIIAETAEYALAFKPNSAFFEVHGAAGWQALQEVVNAVPSGIPVILDAKRGDIASTANAYAQAAFTGLGVHAITLSPYLGRDALAPFVSDPQKGVFVLAKTSNAGSGDVQDLRLANGKPLYLQVAEQAVQWSKFRNVGLVVGATFPAALQAVRAALPDVWILSPGVGAQGGELEAQLQAGLRADGLGLLVTVSRAIANATNRAHTARQLRDQINQLRKNQPAAATTNQLHLQAVAQALLAAGCVRFGQFTLKSGLISPIYIDMRRLVAYPEHLQTIANGLCTLLAPLNFQRLAALPYAALPIGTATALQGNFPLIYPRKEVKSYGTKAAIEGLYNEGETAVVLDDLVTTGESKFEAIEKIAAAGLNVRDIVVVLDREQGARQLLAQQGYQLHALATIHQLLDIWHTQQAISNEQYAQVRDWLAQA
ncbi:MAG TPA: orotidine-5'-phosphate decarboxylase [Anaerolineales bacterium]|nr:orotidine-5'-phosphate decarboxylase [Anaerolineales bacterium]